mmetsp:Transcript_123371/g.394758  ORF Transcript_123371/g.394758 Transcript_123371/m.394758 type:complete len:293 (+) Transcript_123371:61-939(+)
MRHVSLVGSLSLMAALGLRWRLAVPRHAQSFAAFAGLRTPSGGLLRGSPGAGGRRHLARAAGSDACAVLGLPPGTRDEGEVRAAFRKLAKIYHPDVPETGDPVRFQAIQEAAQQALTASGAQTSLDSIFSWRPSGATRTAASSSFSTPSSAARPLEQDAFAASRGIRVDITACAARRRKDLRKAPKMKELTHKATPETWEKVTDVIAKHLGLPPAALHPMLPLEEIGLFFEQGCYVGYQPQANIYMELEEELNVEIVKILVNTWMKMDLPKSGIVTVGDFADLIESKLSTAA